MWSLQFLCRTLIPLCKRYWLRFCFIMLSLVFMGVRSVTISVCTHIVSSGFALMPHPQLRGAVQCMVKQYNQQRNSMSAAHPYLGLLTDCAMHRTLQNCRCCANRLQSNRINSISCESIRHTWPMKLSNIIYPLTSFKVICLCVIRKPLTARHARLI